VYRAGIPRCTAGDKRQCTAVAGPHRRPRSCRHIRKRHRRDRELDGRQELANGFDGQGGNVTGNTFIEPNLGTKRLQLLKTVAGGHTHR
jgi:hypothetical protein